jgi:hypothetical protein
VFVVSETCPSINDPNRIPQWGGLYYIAFGAQQMRNDGLFRAKMEQEKTKSADH